MPIHIVSPDQAGGQAEFHNAESEPKRHHEIESINCPSVSCFEIEGAINVLLCAKNAGKECVAWLYCALACRGTQVFVVHVAEVLKYVMLSPFLSFSLNV